MKRLFHHLHIGCLYVLQAIKMRLEYRADFFVECLASLAMQASGLLMVTFLFNNFHAMREWTRPEVFFIYGFSLIPMACFDAISANFYMFSDRYLVSGELDRLRLRPLSSLFQLVMEGIAFDWIPDMILGAVVLVYAWRLVGPTPTWTIAGQFALCVFGAWGVLSGMFLALTSIAFWSQDRLSLLPPVYNLLNFARYPLNIYRPVIRVLLTWIIPFGFVAFYPSAAFLDKGAAFHLMSAIVPLVGALVLAFGIVVWTLGMRKYSGAGS